MVRFSNLIQISLMGFAASAFALSDIHVEKVKVGDRMLVLTLDDSVQAPDLSKLQIEGYSVENAVFIEEMDPETLPTRFAPTYVDLTMPGNGRIVEYSETLGAMVIDLPSTVAPQIGTIFGDTAFGGLLRKVVGINGQPTASMTSKRWVLVTEEADLPEALLDCDISFKTRLDMNQALADDARTLDVAGELDDGSLAYGRLGFSFIKAQVIFQPMVTGRIRIRNGTIEKVSFTVAGDCEVMADMNGSITGQGNFDFEDELRGKMPVVVPLGSGLFLKVRNRPFLRMETHSVGQGFSAHGTFRIQNSMKGQLDMSQGQWRPLAENKMTFSENSILGMTGEGEIKMTLKPRIEVLLEGVQGPTFTFEPFARFSSSPDSLVRPAAFVPPVAGSLETVPAKGALGRSNKQMSLGTNVYMDMRTNFVGTPTRRSFLLFSREQTVLSPPREGILALRETDSSRISLLCQTFPKADYYIVQQKLGGNPGPWETVSEQSVQPKIRLNSLKPNSQYRFRVIGVNSMGTGPAFPVEGVVFTTPSLNHPPYIPGNRKPDSGFVSVDSTVMLSWKGGDPDSGSKVVYTVVVDLNYPPLAIQASGLVDTALELEGLLPGHTYYWKIIASDGTEKTESPVSSFLVKAPPPPVIIKEPAKKDPHKIDPGFPLVLVPQGHFRREDGRLITVGPFFLDRTEVTQLDFKRETGNNPSYRFGDSLPVERVTWEEAKSYCTEMGGRLPTEAEWEYAARAGSTKDFYWGEANSSDYAWYRDNSEDHSQKVGLKKANAWGLHDMAGNVFEWVEDWYGEYPANQVDHPQGPREGTAKVIRGASWYSESANLNLSARYSNRPGFRNFKVGFRCAQDEASVSQDQSQGRGSDLATRATGSMPRSSLGQPSP